MNAIYIRCFSRVIQFWCGFGGHDVIVTFQGGRGVHENLILATSLRPIVVQTPQHSKTRGHPLSQLVSALCGQGAGRRVHDDPI